MGELNVSSAGEIEARTREALLPEAQRVIRIIEDMLVRREGSGGYAFGPSHGPVLRSMVLEAMQRNWIARLSTDEGNPVLIIDGPKN